MTKTILFVTPNTSIDKVIIVPNYRLGHIHRPQQLIKLAGGKGLNAARAARLLGADVQACILVGGHSGKWLLEQLEAENTPAHVAWMQGETRTCTVIADPEQRQLTELYEYGAVIEVNEWAQFKKVFADALDTIRLIVMSGSLPSGAPPDGYAQLIRLAQEHKIPTFIDCSGISLENALEAKPFGIKINQHEASDLLNQTVDTIEAVKVAAQTLLNYGSTVAVITMGKEGAIAAIASEVWYGKPPVMDAYLSVGSGDALMGAFALSHVRGDSIQEALRIGIAAGLANALVPGTGILNPQFVHDMNTQVQITPI